MHSYWPIRRQALLWGPGKKPLSGAAAGKIKRVQPFAILCLTFFFLIGSVAPSFGQGDIPALVKKVEPSIVVILTFNKEGKVHGQGSGFFLNEGGDVITNRHVLQGVSHAVVKTMEGTVYPVKEVLTEDREGDLIQISADLPPRSAKPLRISNSFPEVGERIIVIGTPFGLEKTVSDGIVSAIRTFRPSVGSFR